MCGINGAIGSFSRELVELMNSSTSHRGPDDVGVWSQENHPVFLGHNRLSIIDLSETGHQPMVSKCGNYVLCYNGEIYNYLELKKNLLSLGVTFSGHSDTEVLLNWLIQYGTRDLRKLNGIFSFCFYSLKERKALLCRDHFGVKPLYYTKTQRGILFSSEMKSFLHAKCFEAKLNLAALDQYNLFLWNSGQETCLEGVKKLSPGSFVEINSDLFIKEEEYYNLALDKSFSSYKGSFQQAKEETLNYLRQAIERQMVADVEVGAFLSGGVDSSAIVKIARDLTTKKFNCFTIKTEGGAKEGFVENDYEYAKQVAHDLNVKLNVINVDESILSGLEDLVYHMDEPLTDPAAINTSLICSLARKEGVPVLLSGTGGDDLFSGYRRHLPAFYYLNHSFLIRRLVETGFHLGGKFAFPNGYRQKLNRLFEGSDQHKLLSLYFWANPKESFSFFRENLSFDKRLERALEAMKTDLERVKGKDALSQMLYLDVYHFLADHNMNYLDKMSMRHSIESRVPFMDIDLVRFAFSLPSCFKVQKRKPKFILREALRGTVPDYVLDRKKVGFGAPIRGWLRGPLKEMVRDELSLDSLKNSVFDENCIQNILKENESGTRDLSYSIFSLLTTKIWINKFLKTPREKR